MRSRKQKLVDATHRQQRRNVTRAKMQAEETTWFRAGEYGQISRVQVAQETDRMLLLAPNSLGYEGRWVRKEKPSAKYFPTFDGARAHAIALLNNQIEHSAARLADLNEMLKELPVSADAL